MKFGEDVFGRESKEQQIQSSELEVTRQEAEEGVTNVIQADVQPLFGLVENAVNLSATDIHIDPVGDQHVVRFRINGIIRTRGGFPREEAKKLLIQLSARARLNIARIFTPQESQCKWLNNDVVKDIRVTMVPIGNTVSVHMRILTAPEAIAGIEKLGFRNEDITIIRRHLKASQGLMIVGGPTGSGKTTTIYSLANTFDLESIIGASIEDPIEFDIPFLRQLEVDPRHDFFMPDGLRTLLRMDPDLLMIAEIREKQSAITAVRAAAAAGFVLTTIHSKDAAAAVEAFQLQSVPNHILGNCLRMIIAQNLVRTLCPTCRVSRKPSDEDRKLFDQWEIAVPDVLFDPNPSACKDCDRSGFHSRIGIFEVVEIDEELSKAIVNGISQIDLRAKFRKKGFNSIFRNGLIMVAEGRTSMNELLDLYWSGSDDGGIA